MTTIRLWRATGRVRSGATLSFCLALAISALVAPLSVTGASAQAIAAAPLVVNQAIRPVALSNGFVNIRDRLSVMRAARGGADAQRVAYSASADGLAPRDVRARWEASLNARLARLERAIAREERSESRAWRAAVERVRRAEDPIREAQRLVHHNVRFRWDRPGRDHWQTPLATLSRGAGDCEDHAILKRALLLEAGVDAEDVSLLFLRTASGTGHVIVQVDTASGTRIMDNRTTAQRIGRLLPGDQVLAEHRTLDSRVIAGI
ncbi:transglutaminase-like cysteine peptidase [Ahrensia marina]|uniref:transglutaminase-like cysteine peptidase n=1 Tax=Ahrensia marina TaxID=1514904 RepID=UPI0035CEDB6A